MEFYHHRLIAYSLGNFAGYHNFTLAGCLGVSAILQVKLAADGRFLRGRFVSTSAGGPGQPEPDPGGGRRRADRAAVARRPRRTRRPPLRRRPDHRLARPRRRILADPPFGGIGVPVRVRYDVIDAPRDPTCGPFSHPRYTARMGPVDGSRRESLPKSRSRWKEVRAHDQVELPRDAVALVLSAIAAFAVLQRRPDQVGLSMPLLSSGPEHSS